MKLETKRICVPGYVLTAIDMKRGITVVRFKPRFIESVNNLTDWK